MRRLNDPNPIQLPIHFLRHMYGDYFNRWFDMKDQIVMSPSNGEIAVAIPLFMSIETDILGKADSYVIAFKPYPVAYIIDCGPKIGTQLMNAVFVEKNLIFLGEL